MRLLGARFCAGLSRAGREIGFAWPAPPKLRTHLCCPAPGGPSPGPSLQSNSTISHLTSPNEVLVGLPNPLQEAPSQHRAPASAQQPKPQTFNFKDFLTSLSPHPIHGPSPSPDGLASKTNPRSIHIPLFSSPPPTQDAIGSPGGPYQPLHGSPSATLSPNKGQPGIKRRCRENRAA